MKSLAYLAVPYSNPDKNVMTARFMAANKVSGILINKGYHIFSPISHTHPIAEMYDLPRDAEYWKKFDYAYIVNCNRMFVLMIDGWKESVGVQMEIGIAKELNVPVEYVNENGETVSIEENKRPGPNIEHIYSNKLPRNHPQALLHVVIRNDYFNDISNRENIVSQNNFLQLALLNLVKDQTFRPHKHIHDRFYTESKITQESLEVLNGEVEVNLYDLDDTILQKVVLKEGDLSLTLMGAHNYTCLSENAQVRKWKTGPFFGVEKDRIYI